MPSLSVKRTHPEYCTQSLLTPWGTTHNGDGNVCDSDGGRPRCGNHTARPSGVKLGQTIGEPPESTYFSDRNY